MNGALTALLLLLLSVVPLRAGAAGASRPQPEILGVRLGMEQAKAHRRLAQLGTLEREERKRQEVWRIRDARYSHLLVGFDKQGQVRYVTALARPEGQPVPYSAAGDLRTAATTELPGHRKLLWEGKGKERFLVLVHGTGPKYLDTWSVKRLETPAPKGR